MIEPIQLKGVVEEDFVNYKLPSMFLISSFCSFKCEKDCGMKVCQNSELAIAEIKEYNIESIYNAYINNPITKAVVIGGLEPFDQFDEIKSLIDYFRWHECFDDIVIYTGFYPEEIVNELCCLQKYSNIVVKFGRFIPNNKPHYDDVLGINLASDNQFAERVS